MMQKLRFLWLIGLLLYGATMLWLSFGVPGTFTSPDENAAFHFADAWRTTATFFVDSPANDFLHGLAHPRSAVALGTVLAPGSFLGFLLLAGSFGTLFGAQAMLWLTPLLTVLALLAFHRIVYRLSSNGRLAWISTILLAIAPPLWYYAARSMMHNVPFVAFLIFAVFFAVVAPYSRFSKHIRLRQIDPLLAGLSLGLAIFIRPSEILWVLPLVCVGLWFGRKQLTRSKMILGVTSLAAMIVLTLVFNAVVYSSPILTGYTLPDADTIAASEPASTLIDRSVAVLFPFGIHPRRMLSTVWNFGFALYPWWSGLAMLGIIAAIWRGGGWRKTAIVTIILSAWLAIVYGSWGFADNPDPNAITLGDSHVRYWLPLFVLAAPLAGLFFHTIIAWLTKKVADRTWSVFVAPAALLIIALFSARLVFFGGDGFVDTRQVLFNSAEKRQAIIEATETDALIVVDRADKFIWPYREVITPLRSEQTYAALPIAFEHVPVYYFGIPFPPADLDHLNTVKLPPLGLQIEKIIDVQDETLYRFVPYATP